MPLDLQSGGGVMAQAATLLAHFVSQSTRHLIGDHTFDIPPQFNEELLHRLEVIKERQQGCT